MRQAAFFTQAGAKRAITDTSARARASKRTVIFPAPGNTW